MSESKNHGTQLDDIMGDISSQQEISMITVYDLSHVTLLKQLPPEDLQGILPHLHVRQFPSDATVINRGDPGCSLFMILSGSLAATLINDEGVEYTINTMHAGDVFGEMALLTGEPRSANVKTLSEVTLVELYQDTFNGLIANYPLLKNGLFRLLAQRMGKTSVQANTGGANDRESLAAILSMQPAPEVDQLLGKTKWTVETNAAIARLVESNANVLILGERGTGKDLTARLIHFQRHGHACPLLHLDCVHPPPVQRDGLGGRDSARDDLHLAIAQEAALFGHGAEVADYARGVRKGYLELADNGTLILENVEHLSQRAQRLLIAYLRDGRFLRQGETRPVVTRVRIIATAIELEKVEGDNGFSPELFSLLSAELLRMKPLRERKKDIPVIAESLLVPFSRKFGRQVSSISGDAMNALVDHEWPLNVDELSQVMERAVAVCQGDTITLQQVFLNSAAFSTTGKANLLRIPQLRQALSHPLVPGALRYLTPPFILGLILFTLLGPRTENPANLIVWGVWWPFLVISIVLGSRSWCGYCPMSVISEAATSLKKNFTAIPQILGRHGGWIGITGFALIILAEHTSHMFTQARPTAFLLLAILSGATITNLFFGRRAWCKYLCPLGRMVAHSSALSLMELGSNSNVCSSQCQTHDCVKDRNCPMGLHPSAATATKDCVLCLSCVKSCRHRSVRIDARLPWLEMLSREKWEMSGAFFAVMITALVLAVKLPSFGPFRSLAHIAQDTTALGEAALSVAVLMFFSALVLVASGFPFGRDRKRSFAVAGHAWLFLGFAGFFNIYFHEFVYNGPNLANWALAAAGLGGAVPPEWVTPNLGTLKALVPLATLAGAVTSIIMLKQITRRHAVPAAVSRAHQGLMALTALVFIVIL